MLASDDSGLLKLRLIVRVVTYVANLLLDLVATIASKRKAKARVEDLSVEMASEALAKGGVSDGLVSHTLVHDCKTGHAFEVWEVGRWGHDDSRMEVLGRGATLGVAVHEWLRGQKAQVRRRFTSSTAP